MPLDVSGLTPLDTSGLTPVDSSPKLDTGGLVPLDTSGLKPVDSAQASSSETSLSDYPVEFGKGVLEGGKNMGASALKGYAALDAGAARNLLDIADRIDRGERVQPIDDLIGYRVRTPEQRQQVRSELEAAINRPLAEHPLMRAGQAVEEFGKETLAPKEGFEGSWTRDIGSGLGSMAAGMGLSMIPFVGPEVAALTFLGSGSGEAVDTAMQKGASDSQAITAAQFGTVPGMTDVVDILLPQLGSTGKVLGFVRRVGKRAIEGAIAEGGQEGLQQLLQNTIAIGIYDPERDVMQDVPRSAAIGAILGGGAGGTFGAFERRPAAAAPVEQQVVPEGVPQGALPADTVLPPEQAASSATVDAPIAPQGSPLSGVQEFGNQAGEISPPAAAVPVHPTAGVYSASVDAPPAEPAPPPSTKPLLDALLADPRSAEEIKAEMQAARDWRPTDQWQEMPAGAVVPDGVTVDVEFIDGVPHARIAPEPGSRQAPVQLEASPDPTVGAERTAPPKSMAQAEAGNYRKRHVSWFGLDGAIETEAGQERTGIGADGMPWSVQMQYAYGEFKRTEGSDGDPVDFYVGPHPESDKAVVIDQVDPDTRRFDEHKVVVGVRSSDEALAVYNSGFSDGSAAHRFGAGVEMTAAELKTWLEQGNTRKPLAYTNPPVNRAPKGPLSLFQFLAKNGGIKDEGGELRAMGLDRHFVPGFGRLVRQGGRSLDDARALAVEAGYLFDPGFNTELPVETLVSDLLNLLDEEARGRRAFSSHDVEAYQDREAKRVERENREALETAKEDVRDLAKREGINATEQEIEDAARYALVNETDLIDALVTIVERSAYAAHDEVVSFEQEAESHEQQPAANVAGAADQGGARPAPARGVAARPQPAPAPEPAPRGEQSSEAERPRGEAGQVEPSSGEPDRQAFIDAAVRRITSLTQGAEAKIAEAIARGAKDAELVDIASKAGWGGTVGGSSLDRGSVEGRGKVVSIKGPFGSFQLSGAGLAKVIRRVYANDAGPQTLDYPASKAIEDALDKIEEAVEAGDRKGVMDAARAAKRVLAATPQAVKDADPEYWSQFNKVIAKMTQPGYVTAKQEIEGAAKPVTRDSAPPAEPSNQGEKINTPVTKAPETGPSSSQPAVDLKVNAPAASLARSLAADLKAGVTITARSLQQAGERAYGAKLSEGKFDRKDLQDVLELAVNMHIADDPRLRITDGEWQGPFKKLSDLLAKLPTQRVRSDEMVAFDQFSTPPNYAAAAVYVANLRSGDTMLEPSAGTGSLVAAASNPGVTVIANELSDRRAALLRELVGGTSRVFTENAEQLNNVLPDSVKPSVVVMNPPFSQTAGRMGDKKVPMTPAVHIEAALKRLEEGGRLVAIVGRGMTMGSPTFRVWWTKIGEKYTVRANIGVEGKAFEKYGTTFGTRLLVIDKVAPPAGHKPTLADVQTVEDLMRTLEPIRNERPAAEQRPAEQSRAPLAEGGQGGSAGALPAPAESGGVGTGERGDRGVAGSRDAGVAGTSEPDVRLEAGQRNVVADQQSERTERDRADRAPAEQPSVGGKPEAGGSVTAKPDLERPTRGQSGAAASSERVGLEQVAPGKQGASEFSESLYQPYEPARVRVKGAKPHPGPLVESASMASVEPPPATYTPHLPKAVIEKGLLSLAQLETTVYAGQAHSKMLPAADGETPKRRGYFIGDGTGVGKGREISGIILDNWQQGRKKAIWISEKQTLLNDAKRDWGGLGQNPNLVFNAGKVKTGEPVSAETGIGFMTYDTLKGGMSDQEAIARGGFARKQKVTVNGRAGVVTKITPGTKGNPAQITVSIDGGTPITVPANQVTASEGFSVKSRIDQLVEWVGEDFDGVIAFDEAHNMGNALATKDGRGFKDAAQKALAGITLQERLPNARVVYVSATGATEVSNLSYASRLGLWGRGTAFASREKFIADVEEGGIAAMELIARDMKQLGFYTARNLSYDGVEYGRVEHKLTPEQRENYDTLAEAWQTVLNNIGAALEETGGNKDARAKSAALSAFWGAHQRFFNQIISSMQMPSVIRDVEADLKAGRQVVLQLTNTNEASQERAAAKATTAEEIEDLDITPRDQIIQLVERSFPTQEYEQYTESVDGKEKVRSRPVVDREGKPVQNKEALRMKEALIDRLASIRVPQGPLDMVLDHFGADVAAEVTGRGRRFILKTDEKTGERKRTEERRSASVNLAETDAFQAGKKKILIFSEAGGTGRSYHADNTAPSKGARRVHYLVQGGWRADKAVQGFGRTHRTNQASAPIVKLVTTDLQGQKRFISSIARRLSQLGALTKGQRQAGDQGIFSARDNLESPEAMAALRQFYNDLLRDNIPGISIDEFEDQTGLKLRNKDDEGRVLGAREDLPPITQFLNRLLSLKIDAQNKVFDAFSDRLDRVIEARQQAGLLDVGLETVKADKIEKNSEKVVHTAEESGAVTKHVRLTLSDKFVPLDFKEVADSKGRPIKFFVKSPKGKVYAVAETPSLTNEKGVIVDYYRLINGVSGSRVTEAKSIDNGKDWTRIDRAEAERLWNAELKQAPEFVSQPLHLITGAILPIWDRLKGNPRVVRLQTDAGEQLLGRVVPNSMISDTLKALGAEADAPKLSAADLHKALLAGGKAKLANGWTLSRRRVANENRIELSGINSFSEADEVKRDGVFTERIDYKNRYFVSTGADGVKVLERLIKFRPLMEMTEGSPAVAEGDFALRRRLDMPVTERFAEQRDKVFPLLRRELDRLGLKQVALRLPDTIDLWVDGNAIKADGHYLRAVLTIAMDADKKYNILQHEAVHALRRLGLFTDGEWSVLTRASQAKWLRQYEIDRHYAAWPKDRQIEEGIAFAYADWASKAKTVDGRVARLFKRIRDFFEAVGNALRGAGFKTAEDIFTDIKSGSVGWRAQARDMGSGQFAREGAIAYAVRTADGDLFRTETVQTADGPREQFLIPGTERVQVKDAGKRSGKAQNPVDGLPLFDREPDPDADMFALRREPGTAIERHEAAQGYLARGQFLDRAIRTPFDFFGGVTRDGVWKPGAKLFSKASDIIVKAEFSQEGRFAFLNPVLETARTGLIDRYSLRDMPDYVERERQRALDERAVMLQGAEALKVLKSQNVGREEAKVLQAILTGEDVAAGDMEGLAEPIRAAIDQLGQEAVALGLVSPESFERNRGAYLHRVYQKYEAEQMGLGRLVNQIMGSRRKKIIGDQFKGRGLFQEIEVPRLMKDVPGWNEAGRGRPQKGEAFIILDELPAQGALALNDDVTNVKPLRRIYWPAETAIPDKYSAFRNQGMWEVRNVDGNTITLWRDFTKEERTRMGEIVDARYTIGKTFMLMAHDLANGRFYKDIAENEDWTVSARPSARWLEAAEWSAQRRRYKGGGDVEWVRVPEGEIPNSGGKKKWGALAGKWVREEIWRDLNEIQLMQQPSLWRSLLTQWKLNKTARSPVVHMNNVMSNFVLMDMADVRWQDFAAGVRSYLKGDEHYEEAFRHGAFGADMMSQEVRDQVLRPILEELERENTYTQGGRLGGLGQVSRFTDSLWSKIKKLDKAMIDAYRLEDELFRMATYMRRRQLGDTPEQAAAVAREQFIDYDIRAPWVNAARNTVLPFISYTYRAAPMVARSVATRPWKVAKYFLLTYLLNALAYWATGDDDEDAKKRAERESRERRSLREQEDGYTWLGTPRMLRMPLNDRYGNPLFLDIRRWVPASDVFDTQGNDWPAWANLGGPLMIGAELFLNRNAFTGNEIVNSKTDDFWDRAGKRADHLYKAWVPSAAWVPGSWYWQKIANAVNGATDTQGRPYSTMGAIANSFGVKVKPQDVEDAMKWKAYEFSKVEQALKAEARRLGRQKERKLISERSFNEGMNEIMEKMQRLNKKREETLR